MNIKNNNNINPPEILASKGLSKAEENNIIYCFLQSFMKYGYDLEQLDYDLEKQLNEAIKEWKYVYSIYIEGKGASYGYHCGKFLKIRFKDIIFKLWYTEKK